jgi:hypothetical protein
MRSSQNIPDETANQQQGRHNSQETLYASRSRKMKRPPSINSALARMAGMAAAAAATHLRNGSLEDAKKLKKKAHFGALYLEPEGPVQKLNALMADPKHRI